MSYRAFEYSIYPDKALLHLVDMLAPCEITGVESRPERTWVMFGDAIPSCISQKKRLEKLLLDRFDLKEVPEQLLSFVNECSNSTSISCKMPLTKMREEIRSTTSHHL